MSCRLLTVGITILLALPCNTRAGPQAAPGRPRSDVEAGEEGQPSWPQQALRSSKAMVVSDDPLASQVGVEILKNGGNAVDAAVAIGFALAVVWPAAGNLAGGGFMLVRMADGRAGLVDYRETAPSGATPAMYVGPDAKVDPAGPTLGYRAVAVPGTVAGMELALRTYGTMKLADVLKPAIRLAEHGFAVSSKLAASLQAARPRLQRFSESRRIFLKDGLQHQPGDIFRQPELAATLRGVARRGAAEFYGGQTAHAVSDEIARMGGLISRNDLGGYRAKIRQPLRARYRLDGVEWEVLSAPPPSSGGIAMIEALNILAPIALRDWTDAQSVHWVAEALRRVFADRAAYLADSDFARVPVRGLTDPRYAEQLRSTIHPERASPSSEVPAGNPLPFEGVAAGERPLPGRVERKEGENTTHFSVVDAAGNAVANTYTLNESYGSGATVTSGFLLNNTMDDFTVQPGTENRIFGLIQSEANTIAPGKRPLSSMTPTILLRDGKLSWVAGSPGGPRIISATLLSVVGWMRFGAEAQAVVNAPRFHHQWMPDELRVEQTMPAGVRRELEQRGHKVVVRSWIGQVGAIGIDRESGERLGAADPRRGGSARGY